MLGHKTSLAGTALVALSLLLAGPPALAGNEDKGAQKQIAAQAKQALAEHAQYCKQAQEQFQASLKDLIEQVPVGDPREITILLGEALGDLQAELMAADAEEAGLLCDAVCTALGDVGHYVKGSLVHDKGKLEATLKKLHKRSEATLRKMLKKVRPLGKALMKHHRYQIRYDAWLDHPDVAVPLIGWVASKTAAAPAFDLVVSGSSLDVEGDGLILAGGYAIDWTPVPQAQLDGVDFSHSNGGFGWGPEPLTGDPAGEPGDIPFRWLIVGPYLVPEGNVLISVRLGDAETTQGFSIP